MIDTGAFERVAEAMGMDPDAFKRKFLNDAPFNRLARLYAAEVAEIEGVRQTWAETDIALRREIDKMRATVYSTPEYVLALETQLSIARRVIDAAELLMAEVSDD